MTISPKIYNSIHKPVWYKGKLGSLQVSPEGIGFVAQNKDPVLGFQLTWVQYGRASLSKRSDKALLKIELHDSSTSHVLRFENRDEASKAKTDLKDHYRQIQGDLSLLSFSENDFSERLHDSHTLFGSSEVKEPLTAIQPPLEQRPKDDTKRTKAFDPAKPTREEKDSKPKAQPRLEKQSSVNSEASRAEDDQRWAFYVKLIICLAILAEIVILVSYFVSVQNVEDNSIFGEDKLSEEIFSTSSEDYYLHDALVASSMADQVLTLPEMEAALGCSLEDESAVTGFRNAIPHIVDKAIEKFSTDRGRIIEYMDEEVEISDGYKARIKGATLSCVISQLWTTHSPAAYASHLVASTLDIPPRHMEPGAYNMSMLLEADTIELGGGGVLYLPKKYCFDLDDLEDNGIMEGGRDSVPMFTVFNLPPKSVGMGSKIVPLASTGNLVSWITLTAPGNMLDLIEEAYNDPKAELLGQIEAMRRGFCWEYPLPDECYSVVEQIVREEYGIEVDSYFKQTLDNVDRQITNMIGIYVDWYHYRGTTSLGPFVVENETVWESRYGATPFLFDRDVASYKKSSGVPPPSYSNPFLSQFDYIESVNASLDTEATNCVHNASKRQTWAAGNAALLLNGAIRRRLRETQGLPQPNIQDWFIDVTDFYLDGNNYSVNKAYLAQRVMWDTQGDLQPGNLTQKRIGKSAKWFMATDFDFGDQLHDILSRHRESSGEAYTRSASEAIRMDNKCGDAATNPDIFVLILGMAATFCGGVNAFMQSIHLMLHWIYIRLSPPTRRKQGLDNDSITRKPITRRLLPTYELGLTLLGATVFFSLYLPFVLQVITEFEIYRYTTSGVDMEVRNAKLVMFFGHASLVTVANTQTQCMGARPHLLALILVNGFLLGVLVNIPHVYMTYLVCRRYWKRLSTGEDERPPGTTVYERSLRILLIDKDGREEPNLDEHDGNVRSTEWDALNSLSDTKKGESIVGSKAVPC